MDLIAEGIRHKLIRFEDDRKYIVYIHQDKRRNYTNPEEMVQAETFSHCALNTPSSFTVLNEAGRTF